MEYAIEMENITMQFGNFKANDNITFKVQKGEVHALIGENGAGKSTLMSILFGMYQPTVGSIKINGIDRIINNPIEANKYGIGMVHQHFMLVDTFTLFENITLNNEETKFNWIITKDSREKVEAVMNLYNFKVDLDKKVSDASVIEQQRAEIIKTLYKGSDIIIFDEPTAVLTPQQIDEFLNAVLHLKKLGKTIIIISHKLDELKKVADRGTVIKRGVVVGEVFPKTDSLEKISSLMVGTKIQEVERNNFKGSGEELIKVNAISVKKKNVNVYGLIDFSMTIKKGEILAIVGVEGNGQDEILYSLSGLSKIDKGTIEIKKDDTFVNYDSMSIRNRYLNGMSFIPQDRHKHGLVLDMKIWENVILQDFARPEFSRYGFINFEKVKKYTSTIVESYDVRSSNGIETVVRTMSGGNQQKLIVGRENSRANTSLLIVSQPTRGLDVGAINNIHELILKEKEKNRAILLISYELDEVLKLADKILVINSGKLVKIVDANNTTKEELGLLMTKTESIEEKEKTND